MVVLSVIKAAMDKYETIDHLAVTAVLTLIASLTAVAPNIV